MLQVGLTGGIASGKSTVSRILRELGSYIVDADLIARAVVLPGQPAYQKIVDFFGDTITCLDGTLDRRKLGDIVFSDAVLRKQLEDIMHPAIWQQMQVEVETASSAGYRVVVLDVPLLFETGWDNRTDTTWVVYVNHQTQIKRLMARDGLSLSQAELRIASQLSMEEKRQRADVVIDNNGGLDLTRSQVESAWAKLFDASRLLND